MHLETGGDVAEVEHDPLGLACGAGGVDQGQQIIHPVLGFPYSQFLLTGLMVAGDQKCLEVARLLAAAQIDVAIESDDLTNFAVLQQGQRLIELGLFANEQYLDAGIFDDVAQLIERAGGVDRDADTAGGKDAEIGLGPLRHVAGIDADHFGWLVAGTDQRLCAVVHGLAQSTPADGAPLAILLNPQGSLVAKLGNTFTHQSNQMKLRHQLNIL